MGYQFDCADGGEGMERGTRAPRHQNSGLRVISFETSDKRWFGPTKRARELLGLLGGT